MNKIQTTAPSGPVAADGGPVHRMRAVVATYRSTLQAYTLVVSANTLMALTDGPEPSHSARDYRAQAHLDRLRDAVHDSGLALPSAIVVAVSGGTLRCECDHLYGLELRPQAGDSLIVLDGYERLAELAASGRGDIKTLVTAVLCSTDVDNAAQHAPAATETECAIMHVSAAARWAGATRIWQ